MPNISLILAIIIWELVKYKCNEANNHRSPALSIPDKNARKPEREKTAPYKNGITRIHHQKGVRICSININRKEIIIRCLGG